MHNYKMVLISALVCASLAGCGDNASQPGQDSAEVAADETRAGKVPSPEVIEKASAAAGEVKQIAESKGLAGAMTATVAGEEKIFYIAGDSNLIEWNKADDGSTRVEIIGSPVADDWEWKGSMELTFNVSPGLTVTDPQLIFRSMGATDFHRTTSGQIVVSDVEIDGNQLTVAGIFSGTLDYQSFGDKPLEGYPQKIEIDDGAFFTAFAN